MHVCGVCDWHAREVTKEEPACVAPNKAPLSFMGRYKSEALALEAPPHFALPLINC